MNEVQNDNFVVRDNLLGRIAIGNLKAYGEGMYIKEEQIDDLIAALQEYQKGRK